MAYTLCTGCAIRYQNPKTGLCDECNDDHLRIRAAEADAERSENRKAWWRDKQRKHRDHEKLQPAEPLSDDADPLLVGSRAIEMLFRVRRSISNATQVAMLDEAIEIVKQLGWGPEEAQESSKLRQSVGARA